MVFRLLVLLASLAAAAAPSAQVRYVDAQATGAGDGTSWADAYPDLRTALDATTSGQVWVAEGAYTPSPSERDASFRIADGVELYGGFPTGGAAFGARDPSLYPVILSGDLSGDDAPGFANVSENSYHVVDLSVLNGVGTSPATVLDGVTITGGNADIEYSESTGFAAGEGGGLRCASEGPVACEPTLRNVRFVGNRATTGGGAFFKDRGGDANARPVLEDVVFEGNLAFGDGSFGDGSGGGLMSEGASVILNQCVFTANRASNGGGMAVGFMNGGPPVQVNGGLFQGNLADERPFYAGGAVLLGDVGFASAVFQDTRFEANQAGTGGAVRVDGGVRSSFVRSTFVENAARIGGALFVADDGGRATIPAHASTFVGNEAGIAGVVYLTSSGGFDTTVRFHNVVVNANQGEPAIAQVIFEDQSEGFAEFAHAVVTGHDGPDLLFRGQTGRTRIVNSVLWDNDTPLGVASLDHAILNGGCQPRPTCQDVIDADPQFVDPDGADGIPGTLDDDVRLAAGSPGIDAGSAALLPPDVLDLDGDGDTTDPLPFDFSGQPRNDGQAPDLGAYEIVGEVFAEGETLGRAVVGSGGGDVPVRLRVENNGPDPIDAQLWAEVVYADGSVTLGLGPEPISVAPGAALGPVEHVVTVPAGSPPGPATIRLRVGSYPSDVIAEATTPVEVSALAQLTVQVTTTDDEYFFTGEDPGECSLREAVQAVNLGQAFGGCDIEGAGSPALIRVPSGLYLFERGGNVGEDNSFGDLIVTAPVRIVGGGMQSTFISADALREEFADRVIEIRGDGAMPVEISDLSITGGNAFSPDAGGGGIRSTGAALTLTRVEIYDNTGGDGGGVFHDGGALRLDGVVIRDNKSRDGGSIFDDFSAPDGSSGGGLAVSGDGSVTITDSRFQDNAAGRGVGIGDDDGTAGVGGFGGGLFVRTTGEVRIETSSFIDNRAGDGGGAVDGSAGRGGKGGGFAIVESGPVTILRTTVTGNAAGNGGSTGSDADTAASDGGDGGGIYLDDLAGTLTELTVTGNRAGDGGNGNDTSAGDGGFGGGIAITNGTVTIKRSLIAGNTTGTGGDVSDRNDIAGDGGDGGGLYVGRGTVVVRTSTLSGNAIGDMGTGSTNGFASEGNGAGAVVRGDLTLANTTVTRNRARARSTGGGLAVLSGSVTLANAIVAGNTLANNARAATADCSGAVSDDGFNVVGQGTGCPASAPSSAAVGPGSVFARVLDADLADNGGPTLTHALIARSDNPAIDIGGTCGPTDQRGFPAPNGGSGSACDAGAVESASGAAPAFAVTAPTPLAVYVHGQPLNVRWTSPEGLGTDDRVRISLVCPGQLPFVVFASTPNDGAQGFLTPAALGVHDPAEAGCVAQVALASDPSVAGESAPFGVQDPAFAIDVTAPERNVRFGRGDVFTWRWASPEAMPSGGVELSILCTTRDPWVRFTATPDDGAQGVLLPDDFGAHPTCRAEVRSATDGAYFGRSAAFEILAQPLPSLTVTAPTSGSVVQAGQPFTITWTTENTGPDVSLRILLDRPGQMPPVRLAQTANDGLFEWSVPSGQPLGGGYRIRIVGFAQDGTRVRDVSGLFEITAPAARSLTSSSLTLERGWTRVVVPASVDVSAWLAPLAATGRVAARDDVGRTLVLAEGAVGDLTTLAAGEAVDIWVDGPGRLDMSTLPDARTVARSGASSVLAPAPGADVLTLPAALVTVQAPGLADGDEIAVASGGTTLGWGIVRSESATIVVRAPASDDAAPLTLRAWRRATGLTSDLAMTSVTARSGLGPIHPDTLAFVAGADWTVQAIASAVLPAADAAPSEWTLEPPYPNPTRGRLSVRVGVPESGPLAVRLYDTLGRRVAVLADGEHSAGWLDLSLDTASLAPGTYVIRVEAARASPSATVTVVR